MKKQIKLKPYHVPTIILKIVVSLIIAGYLYMEGMAIYFLASQPQPQGATDLYYYSMIGQIAPVLLFALAYFLNPRKLHPWAKMFEAILFTFAGMFLMTIIGMLLSFVPYTSNFSEASYNMQVIVGTILSLAIYGGGLYWLRRSGRWA